MKPRSGTGAIAVDANLAGFAAGFEGRDAESAPAAALDVVQEGVRRLTDYQDAGLCRALSPHG